MPFRDAHTITGEIVAARRRPASLCIGLPLAEMQEIEPRITEEVFSVLPVARSVKSRRSFGGTAPGNVRTQARKWLKKLAKEQGAR